SVLAFAVCQAALAGTLFHLGRPAHAWKAVRGFKRSWLSREVVAFSVYAGASGAPASDYLASLFLGHGVLPEFARMPALAFAALSGLVGVYTSVRIYRIPARPAWQSSRTTYGFFLSGLVIGAAATLLLANMMDQATWVARWFG